LATNEVVTGVWLTRAGEALERSALPMITLSVIASWDGTEVIRQEVREGTRFGLRPEAGWNALEVLYILQGEAVWEDGRSTLVLGPGDSLRGNPVQEPCILQARTDLVALYVCSQPVFHQLSDDLGHLREMAVAVELKDGHTNAVVGAPAAG
jgi:mannose-6-phosphate isomerase-like protein (cupin superfamily)